jgi:hypothetical protein
LPALLRLDSRIFFGVGTWWLVCGWFVKSCTKEPLTVKENLKLRAEKEGCEQQAKQP